MADHDVEGDFDIVLRTLMSAEWRDLWNELDYDVESFMSLGIPDDTPDVDLWQLCQEREIILITGNRNREGSNSLQYAIEQFNTPACLHQRARPGHPQPRLPASHRHPFGGVPH